MSPQLVGALDREPALALEPKPRLPRPRLTASDPKPPRNNHGRKMDYGRIRKRVVEQVVPLPVRRTASILLAPEILQGGK